MAEKRKKERKANSKQSAAEYMRVLGNADAFLARLQSYAAEALAKHLDEKICGMHRL